MGSSPFSWDRMEHITRLIHIRVTVIWVCSLVPPAILHQDAPGPPLFLSPTSHPSRLSRSITFVKSFCFSLLETFGFSDFQEVAILVTSPAPPAPSSSLSTVAISPSLNFLSGWVPDGKKWYAVFPGLSAAVFTGQPLSRRKARPKFPLHSGQFSALS